MSTAWSMKPAEVSFDTSLNLEQYALYERVRAAENTRWFVSSNFAGPLGGLEFFGLSQIIDPNGRVVETTGATAEQSMAMATIDVTGGIEEAYADSAERGCCGTADRRRTPPSRAAGRRTGCEGDAGAAGTATENSGHPAVGRRSGDLVLTAAVTAR